MNLADLRGKEVESTQEIDNAIILLFSDGTRLSVKAELGYYQNCAEADIVYDVYGGPKDAR